MTYIKKPKKIIRTIKNIDTMTFREFVVEMEKTQTLKANVGRVRIKTGEKK